MQINSILKRCLSNYKHGFAIAILFMPLAVAAQKTNQGGIGLHFGYNSDYNQTSLIYETPNIWSHAFTENGRIDLNVELGASYWHASKDPDSMGQLSAIPIFRWWATDNFYLEAGTGLTVLSRTNFAGKELSTKFQFGSHLGLGVLISNSHRLGVRYSHYSNANIKKPNPGLDLLEVSYTYQY